MLPTQQQMTDAFNYYVESSPRPSVFSVAAKFGINYDQLRGALILHGECPEPRRKGRTPGPAQEKPEKNGPGRPRLPVLPEEHRAKLQKMVDDHGITKVARLFHLSQKQFGKQLRGEVGMGPAQLEVLRTII